MTELVQNYKILPNVTEFKWSNFAVAIECPSCGDSQGHAGLFPKDDSDEPSDSAFCVKCNETFYLKNKGYTKKTAKFLDRAAKAFWDLDYESVGLHTMDSTLNSLLGLITLQIPDSEAKLQSALRDRGYAQDFINYLVGEGVTWYEPPTTAIKIFEGNMKAPMLMDISEAHGYPVAEFVPVKYCKGLLLPSRRKGKITGLALRNTMEGSTMPRYMNLKTVNVRNKKNSKTDKHTKYSPSATFLDHDLNFKAPIVKLPAASGRVVFITEGELKAMAIHYHFKEATIGVTGVSDLTSDEVKKYILDNREKTFVICPDRDYMTNKAVSRSYYRLFQFLNSIDAKMSVLAWKHTDPAVDAGLKGVDDALIADRQQGGIVFSRISSQQFYTKMHSGIKKEVAKGVVKPGMVFGDENVEEMDFVHKDDTNFLLEPEITYDRSEGGELYAKLAAKHKLIVDISPTGTGKSHRAGLCTVEMFQAAYDREMQLKHKELQTQNQLSFSFAEPAKVDPALLAVIEEGRPKRMKMIEQSPMNNTVSTLTTEAWQVVTGRTATGWTFDTKTRKYRHAKPGEALVIPANCPQTDDIVKLRNNRQVTEIRKDICSKCPLGLDGSCKYWADRKQTKASKYSRMSSASFNARSGDVVFCDDWGSLEHFIEFEFSRADVDKLYYLLRNKGQWKNISENVIGFIETVLSKMKLGQKGTEVYADMLDDDLYGLYPIDSWLELPEPDAVSKAFIKVHGNGIEIDDGAVELNDVKRFLFLFLQVFTGRSIGDLFYKGQKDDQDVWIVKGVDPKYKDMLSKVSSFIIFDATANPAELEKIFGVKPLIIGAKADPLKNITIKMVRGLQNTYKSYMWKAGAKDAYMAKFNYIANYMAEHPGEKVGILTYKELVVNEEVRALFGPDVTWGYWWNDDRASNVYYQNGVTTLFTIGVPIPNIASAAAEVDAVTGARDYILVARPYGKKKENGTQDYIITKDSADPVVRSNVWYKRSAAFIQAIGRLRSVQQPDKQFNFIVMDDIALPFPVDDFIDVAPGCHEVIVDPTSNERKLKIQYLTHLLTMFTAAIDAGHNGMSENARLYLLEWGYEMQFLERYAPDLKRFFTFQDMVDLLRDKIEKAKTEPIPYLPAELQSVRMSTAEMHDEGEVWELERDPDLYYVNKVNK